MTDQIRYDLLTQQALRGVVRSVLIDAAKKGLPGDHHFYISFNTEADGVRMSERLRAQYPQTMTIILQHQFWDLNVTEQGFDVGLSFGGVMERLSVPFDAVSGFFDPSVQFGLQFEEVTETGTEPSAANTADKALDKALDKPQSKKRTPSEPTAVKTDAPPPPTPLPTAGEATGDKSGKAEPQPDKPASGAEVVRLDRFRKK